MPRSKTLRTAINSMPHVTTLSEIKGTRSYGAQQNEPRLGTRRRALYDLVRLNEGRLFEVCFADLGYSRDRNGHYLYSSDLEALRDSYGMDIRCMGQGCDRGLWLFAGEWVGHAYIDHVVAVQSALAENAY